MSPLFFFIITGFFAFIQIEFWLTIPEKTRNILISNPVVAFVITFIASMTISAFTGIGSFVGLCNVCADIGFSIWAHIYRQQKGIQGIKIRSYKMFGLIPVIPRMMVCYELNGRKWEA